MQNSMLMTPDDSPRKSLGPLALSAQILPKFKSPSYIDSNQSLDDNRSPGLAKQLTSARHSSRMKLHSQIQQRSSLLLRHFFKPKLFSVVIKQGYINTFMKNILQRSYIYRKGNKYINEKYLLTKQQVHNENNNEQKSLHRVIKPGSWFLTFWDLIGICIIGMSLWLCPFIACFVEQDTDKNLFKYMIGSIAIYFIADLIVGLNRGFIQKGEIICDRFQIFKHTIYNTFISESINLVMWALYYYDYEVNEFLTIVQMVLIFFQIRKKINVQYEQFYLRGGLIQIIDLISVIVSVYFVAHTMACFWYYIGRLTTFKLGKSWLLKYELFDETLWIKYAYSLYWATMTMVTVGYGDITAQNHYEVVSSIVMMFISSCMFAYSMNSIGYILKVIYDNKLKHKKSLILINQHMRQNDVDQSLQSRIRNFLQNFFSEEKYGTQEEVEQLMNTLPNNLKDELQTDIQMRIMKNIKVLQVFSEQTLQYLSQALEYTQYLPKDIIELNHTDLFFIFKGSVLLQEPKSKSQLIALQEGQTFGEYEFFTGQQTGIQIKILSPSRIYKVNREKFMSIIQYNQKDFEKFYSIKDNLLFNKNFRYINKQCNFCKSYLHLGLNCQNNQYIPDLERLIKKEGFNSNQIRDRLFIRKKLLRINALASYKDLQQVGEFYAGSEIKNQYNRQQSQESQIQIVPNEINQNTNTVEFRTNKRQLSQLSFIDNQNNQELNRQPQMLDQLENQNYNQTYDLDQYYSFAEYMPNSNLELIIKEYEKSIRKYPKHLIDKILNLEKYSFFYFVKMNSFKIRQIIDRSA